MDLRRWLQFPQIVQTSLRPYMVVWSEEARNYSERPVPNPNAQRHDPPVYWVNSNTWWCSCGSLSMVMSMDNEKPVQPLSRSWDPEPRLCKEVSLNISSWFSAQVQVPSPSELTLHFPTAIGLFQGRGCRGLYP